MKTLLAYLKDYKKESILAPLFKMLEASFELFVPLVMAAIIDVGIANQDKPYIVKMCFVLIALGIIGLDGFLRQHGAVELVRGQTAEGVDDLLIGQRQRVFERAALDHLGGDGARCDRAAAAEGLKFDVLDRKSTRLNSSHKHRSRMPSSA